MKVLITATVQSHVCQFHLPLIKMLKEKGWTVHVAAKNNLDAKPGLKLELADRVFDVDFDRSPFSARNVAAYRQLKQIIKENTYDVIHCNTPVGGILSRLAADKRSKVIYTAHGFHFYKRAPKVNWLLYCPIEWIFSYKTDRLICMNREDFGFAQKHLHPKKVCYVHGVGFDSGRFDGGITKEEARKSLAIASDETVLLSVGDINKRKNHKLLLEALSKMKSKKVRLFIAGWDQMDGRMADYAKELGISEKVKFLGYTRQLTEYFAAADLFAFPSLQEGLPVALMEAMAFSLPAVATDIRGSNDLIEESKGGYLVQVGDAPAFAERMDQLVQDSELRQRMGSYNREKVKQFEVEPVLKEMEAIYDSIV